MTRTPKNVTAYRVTARVAVAPRGSVSVARLVDAFRIDPLARRPRI